jgi:molecular chaperone HtpG
LNVDYPFNLTGILYFPKIKQSYEIQKDKIQLYSNQVFVTDEVKDIVPEFLMLMHGVIDSPDIPLNVSRSYLQGDPNVRKINSHITKKVADKLEEIFKTDRKQFEEKWESLGLFVKYGMMTDDKFLEKANKFHILQDSKDGKVNWLFYILPIPCNRMHTYNRLQQRVTLWLSWKPLLTMAF